MQSAEFIKWMQKQGLLQLAKNNFIYFKKVLTECLNAQDEDVLILCDNGYPEKRIAPIMAVSYYYAAKKLGLKVALQAQAPKLKGEIASENIVKSLRALKNGSIIILCLSHRLGQLKKLGRSYRKFALAGDHRFVSTPSLGSLPTTDFSHFIRCINIDYTNLQEKAKKIKNLLDWGRHIKVETRLGSSFEFSVRGRSAVCNDGNYTTSGSGGNIPAGEVYIAPIKKSVNGVLYIDGTVKHRWGTSIVKKPIKLTIERGKVLDISGGLEANMLYKTLEWAYEKSEYPWGVRYIGEFGIGINPKSSLLGATIMDEKVIGTAHVAIGSNYWFGGTIYSIIHLDQVFRNPKIMIDGKILKC
ncbi:MAG: aminopeptidase [Nanoarchaeota archaeon]